MSPNPFNWRAVADTPTTAPSREANTLGVPGLDALVPVANDQHTEVCIVTPAMAQQILDEKNIYNRRVRKSAVERLAREILTGRWRLSGEPIKFDRDGNLLDGQHRLLAIVMTDTAVPLTITINVDREAFELQGTGVPRGTKDMLESMGFINTAHLSAAVKLLVAWDTGHFKQPQVVSNSEVAEWVIAHPDFEPYMSAAVTRKMSKAWAAAMHYRFSVVDADAAAEFFELLGSGEGLYKGHPVYTLRNWLETHNGRHGRTARVAGMAVTIKAWNAFVASQTLGALRLMPKEPFPAVRDTNGAIYPFPEVFEVAARQRRVLASA